jgi:fused signal recognition particle receptor
MASPFEQLVAHLPGALALELAPRRGWRHGLARLEVHPHPTLRLEVPQYRGQHILPEGRIEENYIERFAAAAKVRKGIIADELDLRRSQQIQSFFQCLESQAVVLYQDDARSAPRSRLEAERAAAGEKIEACEPLERLAEPVKQRLAHAVGRRAQAGPVRQRNPPAAIFAADDPDSSFVRMHRPMVSPSWAARLKAGLARTRDVLNTPVSELFTRRKIDEALYEELELALLQADCGVAAAQALVAELKKKKVADGEALKRALKDVITELLSPLERRLEVERARPFVIMIAGVNGSGKTTSIGKLARWLQSQGKSVLLAAGDTFRAAAREQLVAWGTRNAVTVIAQESGDPGAVVFDALSAARARDVDVVIADTAGRLPTQLHLMEEIKKVKRVAAKALEGAPHEVLLVLDANTGQNSLAQVRAFDAALGLTGLILTKLDGTAKGGVVCAIAKEKPVPLLFVGVGEGIDDLRPFGAREFAEALVG